MAAHFEEITGVLVDAHWPLLKSDPESDFFVGKIRPIGPDSKPSWDLLSIVGNVRPGEIALQCSYRFYGKRGEYKHKFTKRVEDQFAFQSFVVSSPHGEAGTIRYIQECDEIGEATARQVWNLYGADSVRNIRENPGGMAVKIPRVSPEKWKEASEKLQSLQALESTSIDLIELLSGRGFPRATPREATKKWGNKAPQIIAENPFILIGLLPGVGFLRCDAMWSALGLPPAAMERQVYAAIYAVTSGSDGDVWHSFHKIDQFLKGKIAGAEVDTKGAIAIAESKGLLTTRRTCTRCSGSGRSMVPDLFTGTRMVLGPCPMCGGGGGVLWVAETTLATAEACAAKHIADAELETIPQAIGIYEDQIERTEIVQSHAHCTRCHRKLTAKQVAILNGSPFGPECITYMPGGEQAERMLLQEWLAAHPLVIESSREVLTGQELVTFENHWPSPDELEGISDHQREIYGQATTGRIGILGGSAGTGKTHVSAAIVKAIIAKHGLMAIACATPTGKAAVRMTEAMQSRELQVMATTIHRLLEVGRTGDGGWVFTRRASNPLSQKFILIDEGSMIDLPLFSSLLKARANGTHILLIGDINQLQPVGPGAPLRDLIAGGVPCGELREIKRNSGTIVRACDAIRDGLPIPLDDQLELDRPCECGGNENCEACGGSGKLEPRNLVMVETATSGAVDALYRVLQQISELSFDKTWDAQVLVAVNRKSPLSRKQLSALLQDHLNPNGKTCGGSPFRVNDKVIDLKNGFFKRTDNEFEDGEVFIANGDMGRVLEVAVKQTEIDFFNPTRRVSVSRIPIKPSKDGGDGDEKEESTGTGCDIELAGSITVHKSQGSEFPFSIVMLDEYAGASGPYGVCDKHWAITGISRGKIATFLIGKESTLKSICRKSSLQKRKTFLAESIKSLRNEVQQQIAARIPISPPQALPQPLSQQLAGG